jgi:Leucine-rich repeat (LRR) protein
MWVKNILFAALWLFIALSALFFLQENPTIKAATLSDLEDKNINFNSLDLSGENLQDIPDIALQQVGIEIFIYNGGEYSAAVFDSLWALEGSHLDKKLLNLSNHKLLFLNPKIKNWSKLKNLQVQNNRISDLPAGFCDISTLCSLDLSANRIQKLPDSLGYLQNLQFLNLSHNQIKVLPNTFFALHSLQELNLSNNQLSQLGQIFCFLPDLHSLDLSNNKLQKLTTSVRKLQKLAWLDLSSNDISKSHQLEIIAWLPRTKIIF